MPATRHSDAFVYEERLSLPWYWWLIALGIVAGGGAEIGAGFTWDVMLGVFLALALPTAALLIGMSRGRLRLDQTGIQVAGRTLRYDDIDTVEALDREQTRLQLGPAGDPAAVVVTRGWIATSVLVRPVDPAPAPYWLVSTRHPDEVLAAVRRLAAPRSC